MDGNMFELMEHVVDRVGKFEGRLCSQCPVVISLVYTLDL